MYHNCSVTLVVHVPRSIFVYTGHTRGEWPKVKPLKEEMQERH